MIHIAMGVDSGIKEMKFQKASCVVAA